MFSESLHVIDTIRFNFSEQSLLLMNITMGFIIFGVALDGKFNVFKHLNRKHKPPISRMYAWLKVYACFCLRRLYYRKVSYIYDEPLDFSGPVIIAANHQNALMDCLLTICGTKIQPVYLARADVFKRKWIAKLLRKLRIAPVYRIRDGRSNLHKNEETFDMATRLLASGGTLALFPEGAHNRREQMLPMKKGLVKIALRAWPECENLKILPLGISYSDYDKTQADARLHFGKAIEIKHFANEVNQTENHLIAAINACLETEIKKRCIHINDVENYSLLKQLRDTYVSGLSGKTYDIQSDFRSSKAITEALNNLQLADSDRYRGITERALSYYRILGDTKCDEVCLAGYLIQRPTFLLSGLAGLVVGAPFFVAGFIFHLIPYGIPWLFTRYRLKDPQFISSIRFAASGLLTFPPYYALMYLVFSHFTGQWYLSLLLLAILLISGQFVFGYLDLARKVRSLIRLKWLKKKHANEFDVLCSKREELQKLLHELVLESEIQTNTGH